MKPFTVISEEKTKYLKFTKFKYDHKKTFDVRVHNHDGFWLGDIKWNGGWRKYIFFVDGDDDGGIIFDVGCLTDIINYINKLMEERKK